MVSGLSTETSFPVWCLKDPKVQIKKVRVGIATVLFEDTINVGHRV